MKPYELIIRNTSEDSLHNKIKQGNVFKFEHFITVGASDTSYILVKTPVDKDLVVYSGFFDSDDSPTSLFSYINPEITGVVGNPVNVISLNVDKSIPSGTTVNEIADTEFSGKGTLIERSARFSLNSDTMIDTYRKGIKIIPRDSEVLIEFNNSNVLSSTDFYVSYSWSEE